jgi:hypothetical protein
MNGGEEMPTLVGLSTNYVVWSIESKHQFSSPMAHLINILFYVSSICLSFCLACLACYLSYANFRHLRWKFYRSLMIDDISILCLSCSAASLLHRLISQDGIPLSFLKHLHILRAQRPQRPARSSIEWAPDSHVHHGAFGVVGFPRAPQAYLSSLPTTPSDFLQQ